VANKFAPKETQRSVLLYFVLRQIVNLKLGSGTRSARCRARARSREFDSRTFDFDDVDAQADSKARPSRGAQAMPTPWGCPVSASRAIGQHLSRWPRKTTDRQYRRRRAST
jgi:hypothetical protein